MMAYGVMNASLKADVDRDDKFLAKVMQNTEKQLSKSETRKNRKSGMRPSANRGIDKQAKSKSKTRSTTPAVQERLMQDTDAWLKKREGMSAHEPVKDTPRYVPQKYIPAKVNHQKKDEVTKRTFERVNNTPNSVKQKIENAKKEDLDFKMQSKELREKAIEEKMRKVEQRKQAIALNLHRSRSQMQKRTDDIGQQARQDKAKLRSIKQDQDMLSKAIKQRNRLMV